MCWKSLVINIKVILLINHLLAMDFFLNEKGNRCKNSEPYDFFLSVYINKLRDIRLSFSEKESMV